jgi:hypothetical protein
MYAENDQCYIDRFKNDPGYLLFDVPRERRSYAVCLEAVKSDWHNFSLVPYDLRTPELCLTALNGEGKKYGIRKYGLPPLRTALSSGTFRQTY